MSKISSSPAPASSAPRVVSLTEQTLPAAMAHGIVLIDWWAPWCGPCRAFAPVFEAAASRHAGVTFAKINTEDEPRLARAFNIRAIPTLMVFRDGVPLLSHAGMVPAAGLDDLVRQAQALDMDAVRADRAAAARRAG